MTDTPTHPIDKELVAKRFSYSRSTYDREASVQRQVAEKMMRLLTDALLSAGIPRPQLPTHFRHIVELGCGTGSYSRMLLNTLQPETLLLNDLCRDMEECVRELCTTRTPRVSFLPGDAEALDFPRETDLITSCSTLQWFNDPGAFLTRCHQALVADGRGAASPAVSPLRYSPCRGRGSNPALPHPSGSAEASEANRSDGNGKKDMDAQPPAILLQRIHNPVQ